MTKEKIIHISHAKESSGWGVASRGDLEALSQQFDVAARFTDYREPEEDRELLNRLGAVPMDGATAVIQYLLPHEFKRFPNIKNIGYFEVESNNLEYSLWPDCFCNVDEIWTVNNEAASIIRKHTDIPTYVVPHAVDSKVYNGEYIPTDIKQTRGNYHFYTIGEHVPRKNLEAIIIAYYTEFDPTEPCSLIIKTNKNLDNLIAEIQIKLKLYPNHSDYARIAVINQRINMEQIYGIHKLGDCYVNASCGESWCLPLVDAVGFGNDVISTKDGGPLDILGENGRLVPYAYTWCHGHNSFPGFQNGFDYWKSIDILGLKKAMRESYNERKKISPTILDKFSQDNFCKLVKERI